VKFLIIAFSGLWAFSAIALTPRESAIKMHNRLTGVPPRADVLDQMELLIGQGRAEEAATIAMSNKNFINVVLKNWVKAWSNRDQTPRVPLNDYVATVLGVVRDDMPFNTVLFDDVLYTVNGSPTAYSAENNDHYDQAEKNGIDLKANLVRQVQSAMNGIPSSATSGVITTRMSAENLFSMGTNRRVNRFTFINFMCNDYEQLHDISIPDYRVRRDVERNPGGDSRTYKNTCVGCHAGQDALGGAYAFYDYDGKKLVYTPGSVAPKINKNVNFRDGFLTVDDSWINTWVIGNNARLGWKGATSGKGAKAINMMFARSHGFAQCMAKKVFKLVCMKDAESTVDKNFVEQKAIEFESGYSMKKLILKTSAGCLVNEE
jgi:hypothetical protein